MARKTDTEGFNAESMEGFKAGLRVAEGLDDDFDLSKLKVESNYGFAFVCGLLCRLEALKGKSYLASWMKRGYYGIKANLDRKWDRLEVIFEGIEDAGEGIPAGDNLVQVSADMSVYLLKMITLLANTETDQLRKWVQEIVSFHPPEVRPEKDREPLTMAAYQDKDLSHL